MDLLRMVNRSATRRALLERLLDASAQIQSGVRSEPSRRPPAR